MDVVVQRGLHGEKFKPALRHAGAPLAFGLLRVWGDKGADTAAGTMGKYWYHACHAVIFWRPRGCAECNENELRLRARRAASPGGLQAMYVG